MKNRKSNFMENSENTVLMIVREKNNTKRLNRDSISKVYPELKDLVKIL